MSAWRRVASSGSQTITSITKLVFVTAKKLTGTEKEDPELAAWTVVANVLLNLDGVLTKG